MEVNFLILQYFQNIGGSKKLSQEEARELQRKSFFCIPTKKEVKEIKKDKDEFRKTAFENEEENYHIGYNFLH